jgi:hypothetical protein
MNAFLIRGAVGLAVLQVSALAAQAQPPCPSDLSPLTDGLVYFYQGKKFIPLDSASPLQGRTRVQISLYYIINTRGAERSGVVVVKTARFGLAADDDTPEQGRVGLERQDGANRCAPSKGPYSGSVSTQAYHQYHDLGEDSGGYLDGMDEGSKGDAEPKKLQTLTKLQRFHTAYETKSGCRNTDDKVGPDGYWEARNNRSQFSFDPNRVDYGLHVAAYNIAQNYVEAGWSLFVTTAQAGEMQLRERRVEIKAYNTRNGLACIPFTIAVRGSMQMLRVNDLESRDAANNRNPEFRTGYVR